MEIITSGRGSAPWPLFQKQYNSQHVWMRLYHGEQYTYPVRCSDKDEKGKEMSSFSFSSFGAVTTETATDAIPTDDAQAPEKDGSEEEAAGKTARADGSMRQMQQYPGLFPLIRY